ncbi:molybdopterin-dependent oxidoreductase [Granulicella sp. L46]|uniref:molybdopterin-containing oxidoreductase family protein n=1 Tax=Granulicella sp. L46 TaxID=1641865 RepID=UPI00131CFFA1|nr:molybdopterin-dependent oxidoreductase [Granulicella sp. L46]
MPEPHANKEFSKSENSSAETKTVHAVCTHDCPDSCGVLVTVDTLTGRATKVQGDPAHPVTRGFLCGKVARYLDRVYSPERLLYPMRRKAGVPKGPLPKGSEAEAFERISWGEALEFVARKLNDMAAEFGPESVLPYSYAGTIGQLGYGSMDRRFFHRLGASQLDRTICASAGGEALKQVYGVRLGTAPQDFAQAGLIIAWGANIHGNNIHLWPFIEEARRKGARLVVIDPYRTRTAALADEHLAIRPGTDGLLALAMMHVLFRDGYDDAEYLRECTEGAEVLRAHALREEHSPKRAAEVTGIAAEAIERLAKTYGQAGRDGRGAAAIRLNYGIQRSENGGTAVRAVAMLPLITGAWKQRGGGLLLSVSGAFPFNETKLRMPELMQASPLGRAARVVNMSELGSALTELGSKAKDNPKVRALFVYNCNAATVAPDSERVLEGLRREDLFTVVHEQFFTDTTDYADVVLPATTFLEHKDVMGAYGHLFAQISQQAIVPLGEARSNVWLFGELGQRMFPGEEEFEDREEELIVQALETEHPFFAEVTKERLEVEGHVALTLPKDKRGESLPFSTPTWFKLAGGRAKLAPVPVWVAPSESRNGSEGAGKFPLEFLPRKADNFMNSTFANLPGHRLMERKTAGLLEMHPSDAAARGVTSGDGVSVWNRRGRITLTARVGETVPPGVVAARLDWQKLSQDGANVNALTSERLTDIGGGATFYSTLVEVAKVRATAAD